MQVRNFEHIILLNDGSVMPSTHIMLTYIINRMFPKDLSQKR